MTITLTTLGSKNRYYHLLLSSNKNKLNHSEELELLSYSVILENQISYNQRNFYISFIEEYLREEKCGTDGTGLFIYEFFALSRKRREDFRALQAEILETGISRLDNFSINSESTTFGNLMEDLFGACEAQTDPEDKRPDHQFRWSIRFLLSEMKECLKGSSYPDKTAHTDNSC
jgi:hypothetical protein